MLIGAPALLVIIVTVRFRAFRKRKHEVKREKIYVLSKIKTYDSLVSYPRGIAFGLDGCHIPICVTSSFYVIRRFKKVDRAVNHFLIANPINVIVSTSCAYTPRPEMTAAHAREHVDKCSGAPNLKRIFEGSDRGARCSQACSTTRKRYVAGNVNCPGKNILILKQKFLNGNRSKLVSWM